MRISNWSSDVCSSDLIFDVSKANGNEAYLHWQVMLASHHCSKSVMYQEEDGKTVLKQDILDDFERLQVGDGYIVSSSDSVPASNSSADNHPPAVAHMRHEERSKEQASESQSLIPNSNAVFC